MRSRLGLLLVAALSFSSTACSKPDPAEARKQLSSPDPKQREKAAEAVKKIHASDPKAVGDLGADAWTDKLKSLPSASESEQKEVLKTSVSSSTGVSQTYRLDDFYTTTVTRDANKKLVSCSEPKNEPTHVEVKAPSGYSGEWTQYYVNGNPYRVEDYDKGRAKHRRELFATGEVYREGDLGAGTDLGSIAYDGKVVTHFKDGKPEIEETYAEGKPNGVRKVYFPSGKLKQESSYLKGDSDGWVKNYREDGSEEWCVLYQKGHEVQRGCPPK